MSEEIIKPKRKYTRRMPVATEEVAAPEAAEVAEVVEAELKMAEQIAEDIAVSVPAEEEKPKKRGRKKKVEEAPEPQIEQEAEVKTEVKSEETTEVASEGEAEVSSESPAAEASNEDAATSNSDSSGDAQEAPMEEERPEVEGILEIAEDGFGFLRFDNFLTSNKDIYVSNAQIRRFGLRTGDKILGISRKPRINERFGALLYVKTVNGMDPISSRRRPYFDNLTPIFPNEKIVLENSSIDLSTRVMDLVAPIGRGQRGLIVAQPKAGKTVLLKKIAASVEEKYPEIELIVLLVDERPEEVTDMKRSLKRSDVIYSTFDEETRHHVKVAQMVIERAKRLAECGKDVMILLDSITRLARAYNMEVPSSGRTLSGGLDPGALHPPKKFFGTARNLEEGGSITILATALVETGSRMDDVIYEEFKGTGNMELHLDRQLSERRIFPAIDLYKSGTRREDLLLTQEEYQIMFMLRRAMSSGSVLDVTEEIIDNLSSTKCNKDFINFMLKKIR